jgi:hypothetical protein
VGPVYRQRLVPSVLLLLHCTLAVSASHVMSATKNDTILIN